MAASIVILKPAHFFSLDNDLIDVHAPTIGAIGVAIYTALARFANRKTMECWPAISRLAQALQLARSTVKVYLRKLERAGLIAIQERQDEEGDPTSHLYTLLDPSPAAVNKRRMVRKAAAAFERGRPPADPPPLEMVGCLPTHPRPSADQGGRPPADPKPDLDPLTTAMNQAEVADAEEETPETLTTCLHPKEVRFKFDDLGFCLQCKTTFPAYTILNDTPEMTEEAQAHAASVA